MNETSVAVSPKAKIAAVIASLGALGDVESLIRSKFASDAPLLTEIPEYLLKLGGKRIRPVLALLTAKALGLRERSQPLIDIAAGIELIHMATLLHDDIIDKSPLRRKEQSPYLRYGLGDTLLSGDFLLVRAFSLCAHLDAFIIQATEDACIELTEGEILETPLSRTKHSIESSTTIARKKTAALFRLASETAAHIATANKEITSCMREFGENLGIAFQILDDVLDVTSTEDVLGKKAGIDIREKKPSLINVLWLESGSLLARELLLKDRDANDEEIHAALLELKGSSVVRAASDRARSFALEASEALKGGIKLLSTPNIEGVEALYSLIDYVLERVE